MAPEGDCDFQTTKFTQVFFSLWKRSMTPQGDCDTTSE